MGADYYCATFQEILKLNDHSLRFLDYIDLPNTEKAQRMLQSIMAEVHISDWEMNLFNGEDCLPIYFTGHYFKDYFVLMLKPLSDSVHRLQDVVNITDHMSGILICDVSGHGLASALVMTVLMNIFRNHAKEYTLPHLYLEKMNQEFAEIFGSQAIDLYATAFHIIIDTRSQKLYYSGAGHPYPCYYSQAGVEELLAPGFPIGLFDHGGYTSQSKEYALHDRLLLFTDGFSEYVDALNGQPVDLCQYNWGTIKTVFKELAQDLKAQTYPQNDHVCMMIVEFS